jgi:hypothetical protein
MSRWALLKAGEHVILEHDWKFFEHWLSLIGPAPQRRRNLL